MKIFQGFEDIDPIPFPVVTTGSFDGVHLGHKVIINRINRLAHELGGESVLITFTPHPRKVLYPDAAGKDLFLINSHREKIDLLQKTGLDNLVEVHFTPDFAKTSSIDFIRNILVGKLHARKIVIGFNHHFGYNREGDFEYLQELGNFFGFTTEEIPEQDIQNETVSSTLIRKALQEGRIQRANAYLDHHYMIIGFLKQGSPELNKIGIPVLSITIEEDCKLIPPDGVYAVWMVSEGQSVKGILNIKNNRYDSLRDISKVEIDIFSFAPDNLLLGKEATVYLAKYIRAEMCFSCLDDLKDQLMRDKNTVDELIY